MFQHAIVVAADGSLARLLVLEPFADPGVPGGPRPRLDPLSTLEQAEHRERGDVRYADKPGRAGRHAGHVYDDHRQDHDDEIERRFAREVATAAASAAAERGTNAIIVVAAARMLGHLRHGFDAIGRADLVQHELPKDLVALGPVALHEHLAAQGLVAAPQPLRAPAR